MVNGQLPQQILVDFIQVVDVNLPLDDFVVLVLCQHLCPVHFEHPVVQISNSLENHSRVDVALLYQLRDLVVSLQEVLQHEDHVASKFELLAAEV